ncbi:protocatechuate 3,4-dioxygenase subunit alpha [Nonomuraea sp. NN258]|uniref:protocatechuate 3,4-dioxygenase subunit alpha n=1 Tax=Nonomuraea antri TaxID=2730852 RepID=UPI001568F1F2|nr:protocatechuate 3,4-dioxygenase subunit alpha [Nonomuraea antri]NRQ40308.1 protocatechuate 3,4-dioxygenase subunit alpha [Nonomuraea antri]
MNPTPSQTVGPFYGYALPFPGGGDLAAGGIVVHGYVYDGAGAPVPDALLEFWQADPAGGLSGAPGTLRRDQVTGTPQGRHGLDFTGFGRVPTDADGRWTLRTLMPGNGYISVCVFARGLLHHLFTRIYFGPDAFLDALPAERRETLVAVAERQDVYRFDIHLQGERETVFLDFG